MANKYWAVYIKATIATPWHREKHRTGLQLDNSEQETLTKNNIIKNRTHTKSDVRVKKRRKKKKKKKVETKLTSNVLKQDKNMPSDLKKPAAFHQTTTTTTSII